MFYNSHQFQHFLFLIILFMGIAYNHIKQIKDAWSEDLMQNSEQRSQQIIYLKENA